MFYVDVIVAIVIVMILSGIGEIAKIVSGDCAAPDPVPLFKAVSDRLRTSNSLESLPGY